MTAIDAPKHLQSDGRRLPKAALAAFVAAAVALGAGAFLLRRGDDGAASSGTTAAALQLSLPKGWTAGELSEPDKAAGLVARASRGEVTFLARRVVGEVEAGLQLEALAATTEKALMASVDSLSIVDREVAKIGTTDVVRIRYRQAPEGQRAFGTTLVIAPAADQVLYLTIRGPEEALAVLGDDIATLLSEAVAAAR